MTDFKIDSGIAVPEDFHTGTRKYPFEEMSAGDSFFIGPNYDDETQKQIGNRVAQARQTYQKRCAKQGNEVTFTQRMWTEQDVLGYRVWRVK
ncbi:MAG TPA: hypothetical protein DEQ25_00250 [Methylophaga sp.]|jgi:hypothetical protein|nr:hypothetical protein [Methylophaga sp.]|tara:strand:- start:186 stop:461 length:276 start_codon:yes stop_codon:yes gene_type:complete